MKGRRVCGVFHGVRAQHRFITDEEFHAERKKNLAMVWAIRIKQLQKDWKIV
jgi:hypothetical protein